MRKIYAFIECDLCRTPFGRDDSISPSDPIYYDSIIEIVELAAEDSGWHCFHKRHYCYNCMLQSMHPDTFA